MSLTRRFAFTFVIASLVAVMSCARDEPVGRGVLHVATPTNLDESGFLDDLLGAFEKKTGYRTRVSAVGSGRALKMLEAGTADAAITHAPNAEMAAALAGSVGARTAFMHDHYVIVGPKDRADVVVGAADVRETLRRIAASGSKFFSRGDRSGTHQREVALWQDAGIPDFDTFVTYVHAGMGATLARASEEGAFTLCDRATFMVKQRSLKLVIVFQGDEALRNTYAVIEPRADASTDVAAARAFAEFVVTTEARTIIGAFGIKAFSEPLFTPERRQVPLPRSEPPP